MALLKGVIRLKPKREIPRLRFIKTGLPWVYSNELQKPQQSFQPGDWVALESAEGEILGYGHYNAHSLIAFRSFQRGRFTSEDQSRALFFKRLDSALVARQRAYPEMFTGEGPSLRLCFGEADGLPGLVIDLFRSSKGTIPVIQCHSAGADQFVFWAQQWFEDRLGVLAGIVRNDLDVRDREHAPKQVSEWGQVPEELYALEGGMRFFFDSRKGQKTGFFYDHRDNRLRLAQMAGALKGSALKGLDFFTYVGGWGLQLAKANPRMTVTCVDVSEGALEFVKRNAAENGLSDRVEVVRADVLKGLDSTKFIDGSFDIVVSDPPAMSASAKHAEESRRAHEKCFAIALKCMKSDGLAALAACSYHLTWDEFYETCNRAGLRSGHQLRLLWTGGPSADHTALAAMADTRYLKCAIVDSIVG